MSEASPGPFNVGGLMVYARGDDRVAVVMPSGKEVAMTATEALDLVEQLRSAATDAEFANIVSGL